MGNSLEERLQQHSHTFDGLLSLIPAKYYYDDETDNQWLEKQNKKSKNERKLNKSRKLNPEDTKDLSVKEIMEETEKVAQPVVLPGEKVKVQRKEVQIGNGEEEEEEEEEEEKEEVQKEEEVGATGHIGEQNEELFQLNTMIFDDNGDEVSEEVQKEEVKKVQKAVTNAKKREISEEEKKARESKQKELKAKLQEKIQKLREKRKAIGSKSAGSATSRQQILEERRRKEMLRKERRKAAAAEESSDSSDSSDSEAEENESAKVIFGNIEFNDGERISSDLKTTRKLGKKKGPSNNDIKGHLQKLEKERSKLQELDNESRQKHEERTKWKRALANVQGEKLKDDEKLLKKALRRKEAQKRKSEREWRERKQNLADELKMKSDRREENLKIRKENKNRSKKDQIKHLPSYKRSRGSKKMTKRAGFEGGYKKRK